MRILAFCLLFLSFLAIGNITASLFIPAYKDKIIAFRSQVLPEIQPKIGPQSSIFDSTQSGQEVLAPSQDEMDTLLQRINSTISQLGSGSTSSQALKTTNSGYTIQPIIVQLPPPQTPAPQQPQAPVEIKEKEIPLSGILLARIMPEIYPKKIENVGIFDILLFRNLEYSTYRDAKKKITFIAFQDSYKTIKANLSLVEKLYSINENSTFFSGTVFLNAVKSDGMVRFVFELEGKAIGIEVPKSYYPRLKTMLIP